MWNVLVQYIYDQVNMKYLGNTFVERRVVRRIYIKSILIFFQLYFCYTKEDYEKKSLLDTSLNKNQRLHCVKSVQIWSYFWSVFSCIRTEYRVQYHSVFSPNTGKYGPEITPFWTLFMKISYLKFRNFIFNLIFMKVSEKKPWEKKSSSLHWIHTVFFDIK